MRKNTPEDTVRRSTRVGEIPQLFVLIGVLAFTRGANAQIRGMFVPTGDMTMARAGHSATLLPDGTVLIAGGDGPLLGGVPAGRSAELYDPATGTFAPTGNMIDPRYFHTATLLPNGKVLIAGGSQDTTAELYDPSTREFSLTGRMGAQQRWVLATLLGNGKVLVAGDVDAELYDPATATFVPAAPYAASSRGSTATLLADGRVLFVGDEPAQLYDSVSNSFSIAGLLASAGLPGVDQQTATLLNNGKVLIAGGSNDEVAPAGRVAAAELYDPATGAFTATSAMHSPRDAHAAVLLPDGKVLIVGGDTGSFIGGGVSVYAGSLASAELYDSSSGTFAPAGSMNAARTGPQATLLKNGEVLITGGFSYCGIGCFHGSLASAELYHPPLSRRRVVHPR
jgi:galactose oxidase-like protein